jgi:hypothetical protein
MCNSLSELDSFALHDGSDVFDEEPGLLFGHFFAGDFLLFGDHLMEDCKFTHISHFADLSLSRLVDLDMLFYSSFSRQFLLRLFLCWSLLCRSLLCWSLLCWSLLCFIRGFFQSLSTLELFDSCSLLGHFDTLSFILLLGILICLLLVPLGLFSQSLVGFCHLSCLLVNLQVSYF